MKEYIIGIDEGTTSERVILYSTKTNKIVDYDQSKITQYYPKNGWVEQDAEEIWQNVNGSMQRLLIKYKLKAEDIYSIGITNQRETTVAWNRITGKPITKAIVWQCRRTSEKVNRMKSITKQIIKQKTGLIVDAYFSATKMQWIMENVPEAKILAKTNNLCLGTIDSYIIYRLTKGQTFATDTTNASRTMLVDITKPKQYDSELLRYFGISRECLPEIRESADDFGIAKTSIGDIVVNSCIGDQQSSLFGQGCFLTGTSKCTYGTGAFMMINTGEKVYKNNNQTLNTVAWTLNGKTIYAIEGSVFNVGSTLEYLKNTLKLFNDYKDVDELCASVKGDQDIFFIPAFTGLGAPFWNSEVRAEIKGLTFASGKEQILKSAIDSFVYSINAIVDCLKRIKVTITELRVDGGVSKCKYMLAYQSTVLGIPVKKTTESESTSMGAIYLAGLKSGAYKSVDEISKLIKFSEKYTPKKLSVSSAREIELWNKFTISAIETAKKINGTK